MFQQSVTAAARIKAWPVDEIPLRSFVATNADALGNAAALLADRKGVRIVEEIRTGLEQHGAIAHRLIRRLEELLGILALEHVHDEMQVEAGCFAAIDPDDPIVSDLCLLADELQDVMMSAGFIPVA